MDKKEIIRLNESQLREIVLECANQMLNQEFNEDIEEGKWNQLKSAGSTLFNRDNMGSLKQRFQNVKKNWNTQREIDNMSDLINKLVQLLDAKKIKPETTVAQLVGGKYNDNKFGTMTGMVNNRKAQVSRRGGNFYN